MIRISKIIAKDKLFDYINDPMISKVELPASLNRALKNKFVCKIKMYIKDFVFESGNNTMSSNIFGTCEYHIQNTELSQKDRQFIKSIRDQKKLGWIKASQIHKLVDFQKRTNLSLPISKELIQLIEKYK